MIDSVVDIREISVNAQLFIRATNENHVPANTYQIIDTTGAFYNLPAFPSEFILIDLAGNRYTPATAEALIEDSKNLAPFSSSTFNKANSDASNIAAYILQWQTALDLYSKTQIDQKFTDAAAVTQMLADELDTEIVNRAAADNILQQNINAEALARQNADALKLDKPTEQGIFAVKKKGTAESYVDIRAVMNEFINLKKVEESTSITETMISGETVSFVVGELIDTEMEITIFYNGVFVPKIMWQILKENNSVKIDLGQLNIEPIPGDFFTIKYYKQ